MAEYFACVFRLGGVDNYAIWYSGECDGLVRENGQVVTFFSLAALEAYCAQRTLALHPDEPTRYDWDAIEEWCNVPVASGIAPGTFLNAWNIAIDTLPAGGKVTLFAHADSRNAKLYEKLFRANNLPALTPAGTEYYATWTKAEMEALAQVLRLAVTEVRQQLIGGKTV